MKNWTHRVLWKPDEPTGGAPAVTPPAAPPPAATGQEPTSTPAPDAGKPQPEPQLTGDEELDDLIKKISTDPKKAAKEIKTLRKEAQAKGEKLQKIEEAQKAANEAALVEQGEFKQLAEQRAKDMDGLKAAHLQEKVAWKVQLQAARMGFNDPEDAVVDAVLSKVKTDKDGNMTGIEEALQAYAEAKPYLVKAAAEPTTPTPPKVNPTNPGGAPTLSKADLSKLTPAQVAAMSPEEVAAILSRGS